MRIIVNDAVEITDVDDLRAFEVGTDLTAAEVDRKLRASGLGSAEAAHAWIDISELRRRGAALSSDPAWGDGFDGMIAYARSKGWCDEDAGTVRAHLAAE